MEKSGGEKPGDSAHLISLYNILARRVVGVCLLVVPTATYFVLTAGMPGNCTAEPAKPDSLYSVKKSEILHKSLRRIHPVEVCLASTGEQEIISNGKTESKVLSRHFLDCFILFFYWEP